MSWLSLLGVRERVRSGPFGCRMCVAPSWVRKVISSAAAAGPGSLTRRFRESPSRYRPLVEETSKRFIRPEEAEPALLC